MMRQTAVLSGRFSGGILGQRSRLARSEDFYQERYSSARNLDLLDPESRQRISPPDWQDEESGPHAPESLSERIGNLQGKPQSTGSHAQVGPRLFPGLVASVLSEDSKRIVGENGLRRFEEFKRYHSGWDYGHGKSLSPRSVTALNSFLGQLPELAAREPSLFLTHQGNLSLGWEDGPGNVVELEFFPDRIEYYIESLNEEGSVGLESLHQLIDQVGPTIS